MNEGALFDVKEKTVKKITARMHRARSWWTEVAWLVVYVSRCITLTFVVVVVVTPLLYLCYCG